MPNTPEMEARILWCTHHINVHRAAAKPQNTVQAERSAAKLWKTYCEQEASPDGDLMSQAKTLEFSIWLVDEAVQQNGARYSFSSLGDYLCHLKEVRREQYSQGRITSDVPAPLEVQAVRDLVRARGNEMQAENLDAQVAAQAAKMLEASLMQKMQGSFGDICRDTKSQQLLQQEVHKFIADKHSKVHEQDLVSLQERIKASLLGDAPASTRKTAEKQAVIDADEWAKIFHFKSQIGKVEDKKVHDRMNEVQRKIKEQLDSQHQEHLHQAAAVEAEKKAWLKLQQAETQRWQREEQKQREEKKKAILKLKSAAAAGIGAFNDRLNPAPFPGCPYRAQADVNEQLMERRRQKEVADAIKRKEEDEATQQFALATRREMEAEHAAHRTAKANLKAFLLSNEENRKVKAAQKVQQQEEDIAYQKKFAAILDKQEADRNKLVERLKAVQAKQATEAASRPESKQWIDPALIERYTREREEAAQLEEQRRKAAVVERAAKFQDALAGQIAEKQQRRQEAAEQQRRDLQRMQEVAKEAEAAEKAEEAARAAKKAAFKASLDKQVKEAAARKVQQPMSPVERCINKDLLDKIQTYQKTGLV
eukprot:jgi/Astpho2/2039/fgenesh1_pg.00038_%23_133_t